MTSLHSFSALLAQAQQGMSLMSLAPFLLLFVAMYFFIFAPQRKKDKEHKKMLSELKTGDRVVTIGGILGTITAVKEDRYHLKVDDGTRIEILRSSVQGRQAEPAAESAK